MRLELRLPLAQAEARRLALNLPPAQLVLEPLDAHDVHRVRRAHPTHRQARALPLGVRGHVDGAPRRTLRVPFRLLPPLPEAHRRAWVEAGVGEQSA